MPLYGMYVLHDMLGKVWGLPYCNVPPSLIVKHWTITMEKNGALSRIKPEIACSPSGGCGALPPLHMWLFPQCCWPYIQSSRCTVSILPCMGCMYCMMCWGRVGVPGLAFLNTNRWKPDIETLEVHYGDEWCFVTDRTQDGLLPEWGLCGSATPPPMVIPLMLLALYSVLTMYCMHFTFYKLYILHDVLWKS